MQADLPAQPIVEDDATVIDPKPRSCEYTSIFQLNPSTSRSEQGIRYGWTKPVHRVGGWTE